MEPQIPISLVMLLLQVGETVAVLIMGWLMMPTMKLMWYMKKNKLEFDAKSYLELITTRKK